MNKRILLSSPTMHGDELGYVNEAFERNWIAPLGFNCDAFETEMGEYLTFLIFHSILADLQSQLERMTNFQIKRR